jgi:hypothetical protein
MKAIDIVIIQNFSDMMDYRERKPIMNPIRVFMEEK